MVYRKVNRINQICNNVKIDSSPFYKSMELKGNKIVLYREKIVKEMEKNTYDKESHDKINNHSKNSNGKIDKAIDMMKVYFKEKLIVFYKKSDLENT